MINYEIVHIPDIQYTARLFTVLTAIEAHGQMERYFLFTNIRLNTSVHVLSLFIITSIKTNIHMASH